MASPPTLRLACARSRRANLGVGNVQSLRGGPGRRCLRGVLLGLAQLGDGGYEDGQLRDERRDPIRVVTRARAGQRDQPGRSAELVALRVCRGIRPIRGPGGAVVGVGRVPQDPAAASPAPRHARSRPPRTRRRLPAPDHRAAHRRMWSAALAACRAACSKIASRSAAVRSPDPAPIRVSGAPLVPPAPQPGQAQPGGQPSPAVPGLLARRAGWPGSPTE